MNTTEDGEVDEDSQWEVGRLIQQAREDLGLSARAASRIAGIGDGTWRYMEAGYEIKRGQRWPVKPTPVTLAKMARAVGLEPRELLIVAGIRDAEHEPPHGRTSGDAVRELDLSGLDDDDLDQLETLILGLRARKRKPLP